MALKKKKPAPTEQARSAPVVFGAEAVAAGTAAGAMMLGVAHADAAKAEQALEIVAATRPVDKAKEAEAAQAGDAAALADQPDRSSVQSRGDHTAPDQSVLVSAPPEPGTVEKNTAPTVSTEPVATDSATAAGEEPSGDNAVVAASEASPADGAEPASATPPTSSGVSATTVAVADAPIPDSVALPPIIDTSALATRIADQITSAIDQISLGAAGGASTAALAESIAGDIAATVADIATGIAASLPKPAELAQTITIQVDDTLAASPVATIGDIAVPAVADLAETITTQVDDTLAASPVATIADIDFPAVADLAETITIQVDDILAASPVATIGDIAFPAVADLAETITIQVDDTLAASPVATIGDIAVPAVADLAETITTQVDDTLAASPVATIAPIAPIADIATDSVVPAVAAEIAVPAIAGIADTVASLDAFQMLETLPSTLLGAESADAGPGGMLTEIFYSDGNSATAAPAPAAPPANSAPIDLADTVSDAASMLVSDMAPVSIDFAGLSYADAPDMPVGGLAGSSMNALHLG